MCVFSCFIWTCIVQLYCIINLFAWNYLLSKNSKILFCYVFLSRVFKLMLSSSVECPQSSAINFLISQEDDVQQARNLIQECYVYYQTMKLSNDCNKKKCRVPVDCERNNAVYNILHFLIDVGSVKENVSELHHQSPMSNFFANWIFVLFSISRIQIYSLLLPWYSHRLQKVQKLYLSTTTFKKGKRICLCSLTDNIFEIIKLTQKFSDLFPMN